MNHDETRLITGSAAPNLRVYRVESDPYQSTSATVQPKNEESEEVSSPDHPTIPSSSTDFLSYAYTRKFRYLILFARCCCAVACDVPSPGNIEVCGRDDEAGQGACRTAFVFSRFDSLWMPGADKALELFRVHSTEEVRQHHKKRIKRTLAKLQDNASPDAGEYTHHTPHTTSLSVILISERWLALLTQQYYVNIQCPPLSPPTNSPLFPLCALHTRSVRLISANPHDTRYLIYLTHSSLIVRQECSRPI